jgi:hypothetical protein
MIDRLKDLIVKNFSNKNIEDKNNILMKSRKEVEINGNGTSGYTIKEGSHKGTVLGHIKRENKNELTLKKLNEKIISSWLDSLDLETRIKKKN